MKHFTAAITLAIVCILAALYCDHQATAQSPDQTIALAQADTPQAQATATSDESATDADGLTRRQRRDLGLLPRQVILKARQLAKSGDLTADMTPKQMAQVYALEASIDPATAEAWQQVAQGTYGVNWEAILAALERIFEFVLKILPLFLME